MAPLFYAALFAALGVAMSAMSRPVPRLGGLRPALAVMAFPAALGPLFLFTQVWKPAAALLALGIAWQFSGLAASHEHGFLRLVRRTTPVLAALVAIGGLGPALADARAERRALAAAPSATGRPNVLLIIWDTVRAMDLGAYGSSRTTTPNLVRLAASGILFERALAPSSWTLPSHATLLTGRRPDEHHADWTVPLDGTWPTLGEILGGEGYATAGFVANWFYLSRESGMQRGFLRYRDFRISPGQVLNAASLGRAFFGARRFRVVTGHHQNFGRKSADHVNAEFLAWHAGLAGRPFFAMLNYYDAHDPYLPPAPFDTLFGRVGRDYDPGLRLRRVPPPGELADLRLAYDQSIAYLDDRLGRLLDSLERRGALRNTLVIVTADHGEEFWEHGLLAHGYSLYLPSLQVPLVVALPGRPVAGQRVVPWVSLNDVAATIIEASGGGSRGTVGGRSLSRYWLDPSTPADTLYAELRHAPNLPPHFPVSRGDLTSALGGDHHYIVTAGTGELFDLTNDPTEQRDLAAAPTHAERRRALAGYLARLGGR